MSSRMQFQQGGLSVCLSLDDWKRLPAEEREEKNYQLLCLLVDEMGRSKATDRLLTFAGSFVASLVALVPSLWLIIEAVNK